MAAPIGIDVVLVMYLAIVWNALLGISAVINPGIPYVLLGITAVSIFEKWPVETSRTQEYVAFLFI